MIFLVKWGDLEALLRKPFTTEQSSSSPIFYFEEQDRIYAYIVHDGYTLCASRPTEMIEDLTNFKSELLRMGAVELLERPKEGTSIVIQQ